MIEIVENAVLGAMRKEAADLGLSGTGAVQIIERSPSEPGETLAPKIAISGDFRVGVNHIADVMGKIAEMLLQTETPLKGGIFLDHQDMRVLLAFSGGSDDTDLLVSQAGVLAAYEQLSAIDAVLAHHDQMKIILYAADPND